MAVSALTFYPSSLLQPEVEFDLDFMYTVVDATDPTYQM